MALRYWKKYHNHGHFSSSSSSSQILMLSPFSRNYGAFHEKRGLSVMCLVFLQIFMRSNSFEPRHDKTNKMAVRPAKTQISLGIRPVWSECSLFAWRKLGSLATHWAHSEDSDQTGWMPRLISVFAGRTLILLVLSCRGSFGSLSEASSKLCLISGRTW